MLTEILTSSFFPVVVCNLPTGQIGGCECGIAHLPLFNHRLDAARGRGGLGHLA